MSNASNVTILYFIGLLIVFFDINRAVVDTTDIVYNRIMSPWLWPDWVFYLHSQGRSMRSCVQTLHRFSENVIDDRIRYTYKVLSKTPSLSAVYIRLNFLLKVL